MDYSQINQIEIIRWLEQTWGNEIMVPVYGEIEYKGYDLFLQSFVIAEQNAEEQMESDEFNILGEFTPGFIQCGTLEDNNVTYHRFNNEIGAEPLVIDRDYLGLAEENIEIAEEFRLLFNLYHDVTKGEYIDLEKGIVVVRVCDNRIVEIHKKYLKGYLAVKNMVLVLHIDSRYVCDEYDSSLVKNCKNYRSDDGNLLYTLEIIPDERRNKCRSVLFGKKLVYGCDLKDCGVWPFEEQKEYIDFIIGIDENGNIIESTSNPNLLNNYFGANPGAPYYLTPVYFDKAVLEKYYAKPEIYTVGDGFVSCGLLWKISIDNQQEEYISAYLGDLGRDLPDTQEQYYWRGYNKAIAGKLSEVKIKRDFLSIATDPDAIDLIFKQTYMKVNKEFRKKLGWSLFLDLDEKDYYAFKCLRIPIQNSISELDSLVLSLVKVMIDSLNEKNIENCLSKDSDTIPLGGISKLEAWMKELGLKNYERQIKFLRNLQELRSSGSGHRKGKKYQKISRIFDLEKGNYTEVFKEILEQSIEFLQYVEGNINVMCKCQQGS